MSSRNLSIKILLIFISIVLVPYELRSTENKQSPYGVKFGQKFNVSEHEHIRRRGNIRSVNLKTAARPDDTEELRAEICDHYGLQIVTWKSHIRSLSAAKLRLEEISEKLSNGFGKPLKKLSSRIWSSDDVHIIAKIRSKGKTYQNQIRYFGPNNKECVEKFIRQNKE